MQQPKTRKVSSRWGWTKSRPARKLFSACRWVHVYLSAASLCLLVFFCFTGILLNHLDWFESEGDHQLITEPIPAELLQALQSSADPPLAQLRAFLKTQWGLSDARKVDLDLEAGEIMFDFPLPAGYALANFDINQGTVELERQRGTVLAVLNDLHKGRHSGKSWSLVIDISAVVIMLLSLTGLVIMLQQAKWRVSGLLLTLGGLLLPVFIYLMWVPK